MTHFDFKCQHKDTSAHGCQTFRCNIYMLHASSGCISFSLCSSFWIQKASSPWLRHQIAQPSFHKLPSRLRQSKCQNHWCIDLPTLPDTHHERFWPKTRRYKDASLPKKKKDIWHHESLSKFGLGTSRPLLEPLNQVCLTYGMLEQHLQPLLRLQELEHCRSSQRKVPKSSMTNLISCTRKGPHIMGTVTSKWASKHLSSTARTATEDIHKNRKKKKPLSLCRALSPMPRFLAILETCLASLNSIHVIGQGLQRWGVAGFRECQHNSFQRHTSTI